MSVVFLKVSIDNMQREDLKIQWERCRDFKKNSHKLQSVNWTSFITSAGHKYPLKKNALTNHSIPFRALADVNQSIH